jgi:hypothetical protein
VTKESVRSLNATTAGGDLAFESPDVDFARFDRFPPQLRWCIANNVTKLAAVHFQAHYEWARSRGGARLTIAKIDRLEMNEIAVFAGEYRGKYKMELPHIAAQVSVQRYGQMGPSKHPPRRFGPPIFRPQHSKRRLRPRVIRLAKEAA